MNDKNIQNLLTQLFEQHTKEQISLFEWLPISGSIRKYARITSANYKLIGTKKLQTYNKIVFFTFTQTFKINGIKTPEWLAISKDKMCYLQSDLGNQTLQNFLQESNVHEEKDRMIRKVLSGLANMQFNAYTNIDFSKCFPRDKFDKQSIQWDFNYFKYNFLKIIDVPFDEQKLEDDFLTLIESLLLVKADYFMHRDFQSSNIMIFENEPWFIDFQGGRKGPLQYDLVSLLYSPRKRLKQKQITNYFNLDYSENAHKIETTEEQFKADFYRFALARIMQALGAYGYRGIIQNKFDFIKRIPLALTNLMNVWAKVDINLPELTSCFQFMFNKDWSEYYSPENENLTIRIKSFSYKKRIPRDPSGNGGGFVFDCRALPNPHRDKNLRPFNGTQKEIQQYFATKPQLTQFLNHAQEITQISISNYQLRNFNNLCVNFGCTGGKHRSVYCAEKFSQWVENNFNVKVVLIHTEKENWS